MIKADYQIELPEKVQDAISAYKENNDWLAHFLEECCELDESYVAKSGEVYDEYRAYCTRTGGYIRSTTDFYMALDLAAFARYRDRKGRYIKGLRIKSDFLS